MRPMPLYIVTSSGNRSTSTAVSSLCFIADAFTRDCMSWCCSCALKQQSNDHGISNYNNVPTTECSLPIFKKRHWNVKSTPTLFQPSVFGVHQTVFAFLDPWWSIGLSFVWNRTLFYGCDEWWCTAFRPFGLRCDLHHWLREWVDVGFATMLWLLLEGFAMIGYFKKYRRQNDTEIE